MHATTDLKYGNCYVASEVLYHLLGGKRAGYTPMTLKYNGVVHWFLRHFSGLIIDPIAKQFKTKPNYKLARGRGFLTKRPSKRAKILMEKLLWQVKNERIKQAGTS